MFLLVPPTTVTSRKTEVSTFAGLTGPNGFPVNGRMVVPCGAVDHTSPAKTAEVLHFRVRQDSAKFAEHGLRDCGLKWVLLFFWMEGNVTFA